ncbi:MAG TPA: hypothetical protein VEZ90_04280, partial [Blastocatellia bacterium]|nr:hypothetical protein [Blastocatellia bacterium]
MPDNRLRIGMHFLRQGRECVVEGDLHDGRLKIKDIMTGESRSKPISGVVKDLFEGKIELLGKDDHQDQRKDPIRDLSELAFDDRLRERTMRRYNYVDAVVRAKVQTLTQNTLCPIIGGISKRIRDKRPPSWWTVYRWVTAYMAAGMDIRSIVPDYKGRGNRKAKISGKQMEEFSSGDWQKAQVVAGLVNDAINTKYLSSRRASVRSVHRHLEARIREENRYRDPHDRLPLPHVSSLYRYIERLDRYDVARARFGKRFADEQY